jgi:hypothetical protein
MKKPLVAAVILLVGELFAPAARAETLQVPAGGKAVPVGKDRVLCGDLPDGWQVSGDRRMVRPLESVRDANRTVEASLAASPGACARSAASLTLVASGAAPQIDAASVSFYPDEGRLELKGTNLEGMQVLWQSAGQTGQETCLATTGVGNIKHCVLPLQRKLPSQTVLHWLPAFARSGPDTTTYDAQGVVLDPATFVLHPAHIVIEKVFTPTDTVDVSQGQGLVPMVHPEAVANVDCGVARCEIIDGNLVVRSVPVQATQLTVSARLAPRFSIARGDKLDGTTSATFALLRCPLAIVSGPPLRDAEAPQILVRMPDRCRSNARLRWSVGTEPAEVVREVRANNDDLFLLRTGQIAGGTVTVTAARSDGLSGVVGVVSSPTMAPPRPQSTIELPGHGPIAFIPNNRDALWSVAGVSHARLVPLDVPGVYSVRSVDDRTYLRGDRHSTGFVSLRYAYRRGDMPKGFEEVNLAILTEAVERPLHEASVPVPFTSAPGRNQPFAELLCADRQGVATVIPPGMPARIGYAARDTCRVVIHQERLRPEDGQQEVVLEIEVTKTGGGKRSDAGVSEHLVLRPGGEVRVFYAKGVLEQFDQITVRLSHVMDEEHYVLGAKGKPMPPSAQWSVTIEGGRARLYVSLNVPAGLYRINEPAASLTLNFGVLGRITWLDRQGKEGLLGLETGVLGASLIPQQYNNNPAFPATLLTLLGIGLRVEVGQGAAIGVHLWGAYEFRSEYEYTPPGATAPRTARHWSLLFGPSISIGNVGTNL